MDTQKIVDNILGKKKTKIVKQKNDDNILISFGNLLYWYGDPTGEGEQIFTLIHKTSPCLTKISWRARTYAGYGEDVYGDSEEEVLEKIIEKMNAGKISEKNPVSLVYAKMKSKSKNKGFML